jgi:hypothetical protein
MDAADVAAGGDDKVSTAADGSKLSAVLSSLATDAGVLIFGR